MQQRSILRLATLFVLASSLLLARAQYSAVRINELLADNTTVTNLLGTVTDMVELYNTSFEEVDISDCSLSDSNAFPRRYVFPAGTVIPPNGYLTLIFDSRYPGIPSVAAPFGISAKGGFLYFYTPAQTLIDQVEYGLQLRDHSIVRTGPTTWALGLPSIGQPNSTLQMGSPFALRINEWLADQDNDGPDDYFELYNTTNKPVALGGIYLTDQATNPLQYAVAPLSFIGTGGQAYVVFEADSKGGTTGSTNRYPADQVNFGLRAAGESIIAYTPSFQEIHRVTWTSSIQNVSEGFLTDGNTNNRVYFPKIGDFQTRSPGDANFLLLTNVTVNEVLTHTDLPREDVVEFVNRSAVPVDISGWWLSNARGTPKKYLIPPGPAIPPGGYRLIYEGVGTSVGFNSSSALVPFTFNSARGDDVVLSQADGSGNLTGYRSYEEFEAAANGISFGYYKTSVPNDYKFVAMAATTFGQDEANTVQQFRLGTGLTNAYPKIGPVVINEILYAPTNSIYFTNGVPVFGPNPYDEFIELRNVTDLTVPLYDPFYPTNRWRLQNAVEFTFPLTNLAPNSFCLVVNFNPHTEPSALATFRNRFSVPMNVPIFGPWIGSLNNGGEGVELYRPDTPQGPDRPDAGLVPYIRVDKVNYKSNNQWPIAEASHPNPVLSLQRKNSLLFGNDPINWASDRPTAGVSTPSTLQDTDGDGMPDAWENQYGFNPNSGADASQDADLDGTSNLGEYVAGTHPHQASSVLRVFDISRTGTNGPAYIRFTAYPNASYTVQSRNSMAPGSDWKTVDHVNPAPTMRLETVIDNGATNKNDRYYRVVAPATN